jgi:hypothetical protein
LLADLLDMVGQCRDLSLQRIDARAKIACRLTLSGGRSLLGQHRPWLGADERFERADHHLKVFNLLLEPAEPRADRIVAALWRTLLGKDRQRAEAGDKKPRQQSVSWARSPAPCESR